MRRSLVVLRVALLVAVLSTMALPAPPPSSAVGPDPGPANPWLHRRVLAAAHAGGEDEAPHSTLFAFGQANGEGVHILDTDLQLTRDGVPVIMHNASVDTTTNGHGLVADMTYAEVHALDAGYWYSDACWACHDRPVSEYKYRGIRTGDQAAPSGFSADDFGVASFRELFQRYPDKIIDIEIKGSFPAQVPAAQALADLIHEFHRETNTIVTSFDDKLLDAFKQLAPEVTTSAAKDAVTKFFGDRQPVPGHQILDVPPFYDLNGTRIEVVSKKFVDDAHTGGMAVWVWMDSGDEENADFYSHLIDLGVDGILASRPSVLMSVINRRGVGWDGREPAPGGPAAPPVVTGGTSPAASNVTGSPGSSSGPTASPSAATPVAAAPQFTG